jgi:hypothetical protein
MTPTERDPIPQPTDRSGGDVPGIDADASLDADTEGHSLLDAELARSLDQSGSRPRSHQAQSGQRLGTGCHGHRPGRLLQAPRPALIARAGRRSWFRGS